MDKSYIICHNTNGFQTFDETNSVEDWALFHPTSKIVHVFKKRMDIQAKRNNQEAQFLKYCYDYGLTPNDLHAKFITPKNETIELVGFNQTNKKYKFIVKDVANNTYKVSKNYINGCTRIP